MVASLKPQKSTNSLQPGDPAPLIGLLLWTCNRPFPSPSGPLYQNEVKCSAFDKEMIFILMQIKLIVTRKVVHLASFWKWGFLELESGLLITVTTPVRTSLANIRSIFVKFS